MLSFNVVFSEEEARAALGLFDLAVKAEGIRVAGVALQISNNIAKAAEAANHAAAAKAKPTEVPVAEAKPAELPAVM